MTLQDTLLIHADQIARFGGTDGVRDRGLLESAIAQPQMMFSGVFLHATLPEQAAAYLFHLALNHPLIDGNKRTAFAVTDAFLRLNEHQLQLSDTEAYDLVLAVATGEIDKTQLSARLTSVIAPLA